MRKNNKITNNMKADEILQISDKNLLSLINAFPEGIVIASLDGLIQKVSGKILKMFGYDNAVEVLGKNFLDFVNDSELQRADLIIKEMLKGNYTGPGEYLAIKKDGSQFYIEANAEVLRDEQGEANAILIIVHDITKRRLTEATLKSSEEKYRLLADYATDVIWIYNFRANKFTYVSPSILNSNGFTVEELMDKTLEESLTPESYAAIKDSIEININKFLKDPENPEYYIYEVQQPKKNGEVIWIEASVKARFNSEGDIEIVGVNRNIEERKKHEKELLEAKEQAERNSHNKGEYIANMSHELRTPLNVMLGIIQLFEIYMNGDVNDIKLKAVKHIHTMRQNCLRLVRLVNNLIDSTKLDAGHFELMPQNYDIVKLIEEITLYVYDYVKLKNIELLFNTNVKELIIACDADIIERIMLNLISNAIKFTNPNGVIRINIEYVKDKILIYVIDNGIGIPKDKQEMVFERYKQVEKLLAREHEGSGIGLTLTKSLIEMHGGKITLKSELGIGSEFVVELPIRILKDSFLDKEKVCFSCDSKNLIEKMNIEFSDIYK